MAVIGSEFGLEINDTSDNINKSNPMPETCKRKTSLKDFEIGNNNLSRLTSKNIIIEL